MAHAIENNLTKGNVVKQLVRYALPLVTTSLLQALYNIVDSIVVGQFVGAAALSGINNAGVIMNMITQIIIAFTIGGNVLISQYFGSKEEEHRKMTSGTLFTFCMIAGIVVSVALFVLARPILIALGAPALEEAVDYLSICSLGIFFIFGYNALSAILRAVGNSTKPLHFIIISTVVNIVLDLLFVAVLGWGIKGAAFATLVAQIISFLAALFFCLKKKKFLGLGRKFLRVSRDKILKICKFGFPLALQWSIAGISWLAVAFLINKYDVACSAGNGISAKIKDLCQLFISAMASGAATMIAQNLGARLYDRAYEILKICIRISLVMAVILIVIAQLFAPQMVSIFTNDPETHMWAVRNLRIEIFAQIFYAVFLTYNSLATGSGHTIFVMLNSFVNCILVRLILAVILERFLGVTGVFIACAIAPLSSVPIGWWFARSGRWKNEHIAV